MSKRRRHPEPPGITLGDILYVVFRHKWKIVLISTAGFLLALALPFFRTIEFQSEAKLYIRYVLETKSPTEGQTTDGRIRSPDERGDSIMSTELEILTSLDLAQAVVDAIGPDKILVRNGRENDRYRAADLIRKNLSAEVAKNSSVIRITFHHSDPSVVQPVLKQLIASYFKKHGEIHAVGAFDDFLTQETEQLHSRLLQTEEALRKTKAQAGVISLEESKKAYAAQIARLAQGILDAEAELAEQRAETDAMAKLLHTKPPEVKNGNSTNSEIAAPLPIAAEYKTICGLLDSLEKKKETLLVQYTERSALVAELQAQIEANEKSKAKLESEFPVLTVRATPSQGVAEEPATNPKTRLMSEIARVTALESKINVLKDQLEKARKEASALDEAEGSIEELNRKHVIEAADYESFQKSLEQARIDEKLGAGKVANISTIQEPSPPLRAPSKLRKAMASILLAGIAAALALAFAIEFFWDRSLRRPMEIETKLGLPLFMSIPLVHQNGKSKSLRVKGSSGLLLQQVGERNPDAKESASPRFAAGEKAGHEAENLPSAPWHPKHVLRPFCEALRDRLITFFEVKGLTRKPKLVGITSCGEGSGVSTIAAGMAASLSETGDGNVLLVDLNLQNGAAHQFFKGAPACGLDEALEAEKRSHARVQDNLYVVAETTKSEKLPCVLPKRFLHLVPRMKASDYDYIIFDLPPISQTSVTPRLARSLDMVLMVVESEKTDCEVVKSASALIADSCGNIGVVLNKRRTYVPRQLQQEL
jgi:uncharacterized protein involved in exopolysaccharide biosynthesis/Mrp family chromosome partitioning ATPase